MSNDGYRLDLTEYPDGLDAGNESFGITIRRHGDNLIVELRAPVIDLGGTNQETLKSCSKVHWDLKPKPPLKPLSKQPRPGKSYPISDTAIGHRRRPPRSQDIEVTIDGT